MICDQDRFLKKYILQLKYLLRKITWDTMGSLRSFTSTRHCIKHPTFTHVIARICVQRNCRELNCGCNVKMTRPKNTYWATTYNFKKIHDDNFSIRYASIDLNIYTITFIQVLLLFLWGILWFRLWYFCWCGSRWCQSLVRGVFCDNSCGTSFGKNSSYRIDNSYKWKEENQHGSWDSVLQLLWWRVFKNLFE